MASSNSIYYYDAGKSHAEYVAHEAEIAYKNISKYLDWDLKKRYSIIIYNSHNEFQQTNIISVYMSEGIGGVTELFKNRVVFPFDGDFEQFRYVIHHELVHAMLNDMVYGGRMQNVVSSRTRIRVPIWSNEGLAEYLSSNWDTKADMVLRDVAVHERMPSVKELNYFILLSLTKGRRGGVVTQRTANPWTPVRIRSSPPLEIINESTADFDV